MTGKTFSRRDFLRVSALTAAGAALAGCTTPTPEQVQVEVTRETEVQVPATVVVEATAPPPEEVTVTWFVGFGTGTSAEAIAIHQGVQDEFNAQSDLIKLNILTVPYAERNARFATMLAAGMAPEFCMPIGVQGISDNYEVWADITPYVERDNYDMSIYFGAAVELHNHPDKGLLGLPLGVYPTVTFYNEDLFDAAGLDYPPHTIGDSYADGSAWTYDKMVELARQITVDAAGNNAASPAFTWEDTTQWGWNGWDWQTPRQWPAKWGGNNQGVSGDMRTSELNAQPWLDMAQFHKDTIWTWHIRATGEQSGSFYSVAGDPMGSGMVGMWECHSWMAWAYPSWTENFNWDIGAVPTVEGFDTVAPIHADTFGMVQAARYKDQAWEAIKWVFQPDIQKTLDTLYGCIPAQTDLAATWVDDQTATFPDVDFAVFVDAIPYLDNPQHEGWIPAFTRVWQACDTAWGLIAAEGGDVQEVMDNLNAEAQGYMDEWWTAHPNGLELSGQ
jgi:multiple sugar transport system substrate-binding protein